MVLKGSDTKNKTAYGNIGGYFGLGCGVPADKYKALEWYHHHGTKYDKIKEFRDQGVQISNSVKKKPFEQIIVQTEDILCQARDKTVNRQSEEVSLLEKLKIETTEEPENQTYLGVLEQKLQQAEALLAAKNKREDELRGEIDSLKQLKNKMEKESGKKIKSLENEIQSYRLVIENKQQETHQGELVEQYKKENERLNNEIQSLKMTNTIQLTQLELKDSHIKTLEKVTASLCTASEKPLQDASKSATDLERSDRNFERMLEQERRMRDNGITLLKQQMEVSLNKEKIQKRKLEVEKEALNTELKRLKTSAVQDGSTRNNDRNSAFLDDIDEDKFNSEFNERIKIETCE